MIVGIDASRNRSGGAKAHIIGILEDIDLQALGIKEVHLWSYRSLLDSVKDMPWLKKHNHIALEQSLVKQVMWQYFTFPKEARANKCDIILYTDAGALVNFHPCIVMSRDMLSYEKGEMNRFGFTRRRLRLLLIKYTQVLAMKKADGVLFLTKYAADVIQNYTGSLRRIRIIPHGVGKQFRVDANYSDNTSSKKEIKCLYVSNASMYKHQWHVIDAIAILRKKGLPVSLLLAGGGTGPARAMVYKAVERNHAASYVQVMEYVLHKDIPSLISGSDIFIFASSCENMPNTLIEGMAAGLPIACSNRGPMPEVLRDGGVYFDPEKPHEIAGAIEKIIIDKDLRCKISERAHVISREYSWKKCSEETFMYLKEIYKQASANN